MKMRRIGGGTLQGKPRMYIESHALMVAALTSSRSYGRVLAVYACPPHHPKIEPSSAEMDMVDGRRSVPVVLPADFGRKGPLTAW